MDGKIITKLAGIESLLIFLLLTTSISSCKNDEPLAHQLTTFVVPVTVQPADSILELGDTLWLRISASDSLYEYHTQKKYKLPNFDFGQTSIGVRKLVDKRKDLSDQLSAVSDFEILTSIGSIDFLGNTFIDIKFVYEPQAGEYLLKFGFVPKSVGVYCFAFLSASSLDYKDLLNLGKDAEGAKVVPLYDHMFFPINNSNNNFELFKKYCFDSSALNPENYQTNNYIRYGTFTFRVVE